MRSVIRDHFTNKTSQTKKGGFKAAWRMNTATHCNILQHTATPYNTLQHTLPWSRMRGTRAPGSGREFTSRTPRICIRLHILRCQLYSHFRPEISHMSALQSFQIVSLVVSWLLGIFTWLAHTNTQTHRHTRTSTHLSRIFIFLSSTNSHYGHS